MNKQDFIEKLNHTKPFLMSQDFIPILTHFCFDEKHVSAYNDVAGISISMESELHCAVPGQLLLKMLGTIGTETVRIEMPTEGTVKLISGKTNVKLPSLPPEDFVFELPDIVDVPAVKVPKEFLIGLSKCLISVGQDPSHPEQTGVAWAVEKNKISIYSTNNRSISKYSLEQEGIGFEKEQEKLKVIIPAFFCEEIIALADVYAGNDDSIDLYIQDITKGSKFVVAILGKHGSCKIFTRLINGEFMNFEGVIERMLEGANSDSFVEIPEGLAATLERASLLLSVTDNNNSEVSVNEDEVTLLSESSFGKALDVIKFPKPLGTFRFDVDPVLIQNGFKVANKIALLPKLIVLTTDSKNFTHLISHSNTGA